jgi:hypothetical protein
MKDPIQQPVNGNIEIAISNLIRKLVTHNSSDSRIWIREWDADRGTDGILTTILSEELKNPMTTPNQYIQWSNI